MHRRSACVGSVLQEDQRRGLAEPAQPDGKDFSSSSHRQAQREERNTPDTAKVWGSVPLKCHQGAAGGKCPVGRGMEHIPRGNPGSATHQAGLQVQGHQLGTVGTNKLEGLVLQLEEKPQGWELGALGCWN